MQFASRQRNNIKYGAHLLVRELLHFIRAKLAALLNLAKSPFVRANGQIVLYESLKIKEM